MSNSAMGAGVGARKWCNKPGQQRIVPTLDVAGMKARSCDVEHIF